MIKWHHVWYVFFFSTLLKKPTLSMHLLQSLLGHLSVIQNFIFSLNIPSEFAFLMLLGINSHILGGSEDMLSVPKYNVWFLRICSSGSFFKLYGFYIKWKVSFKISGHKSFLVLLISVARICRFFWWMNARRFVPF